MSISKIKIAKKSNHGERAQIIVDAMKKCFKDLELPIHNDIESAEGITITSNFLYATHTVGITASFYTEADMVEVALVYGRAPEEKINQLYELANRINVSLVMGHYVVDPDSGQIQLRSAFFVTRYSLNKDEFKKVLNHCLATGHKTISMIGDLLLTDKTPASVVDEGIKMKGNCPPEFTDKEENSLEVKVNGDLPFIVHACIDMPAFPTHTHGLTDVGMPEFLMDHLAFGPYGNGGRINSSYKYFSKPENADKLKALKQGKTVKLTVQDLEPIAKEEPHPYCYRRVEKEFEMVRQAYDLNDPYQVTPETWFVQLYVEGDNFALTDEYYKGGIKW